MAIVFAILKTILKILLIILALIILLILLILFVPFRYKAAGVKEPGTIEAQASVTWLLHMLTVEVGYELSSGRGLTKDIRLFGISVFKVRDWLNERRKSKAEKEREKRKQEKRKKLERMKTEDPERYEQLRAEALARKEEKRKAEEERRRQEEERRRIEAERAEQEALKKKQEEEERIRLEKEKAEAERIRLDKEEEERIRLEAAKAESEDAQSSPKPGGKEAIRQKAENIYLKLLEKILKVISRLFRLALKLIVRLWHLPGKIISVASKICRKIEDVGDKVGSLNAKVSDILDFLQDEHTQEVLSLLKKQIARLLGHILPKKLAGYVQFGLEDPYLTGRVLATACAFYPLYGKTFRLEPDFEDLVFNGRAELKGRVYLFYLAFIALSTYFNKNTKFVINYIKSFRNKEEAE